MDKEQIEIRKAVASWLTAARHEKGLTAQALCDAVKGDNKLGPTLISSYEHARYLPALERAKRIATALNTSVPTEIVTLYAALAKSHPHMAQCGVGARLGSAVIFVRAWQNADSLEALSKTLGIPAQILYQRACNYRKKGVELKRFSNKKIDWAELAKIANEELEKQKQAAAEAPK